MAKVFDIIPNALVGSASSFISSTPPLARFDSVVAVLSEANGHNPDMVAAIDKLAPGSSPDDGLFLKLAQVVPDKRVIKTHLPLSLLPANMLDTCKVS